MWRRCGGFSLLEILAASVILMVVLGAASVVQLSAKRVAGEVGYRYTALNLAREILEFGETGTFAHPFRLKYYYPAATVCTLRDDCYNPCGDPPCGGTNTRKVGYAVKEWSFFMPGRGVDPFDFLGDVLAKGLVPAKAPESVVIEYAAEPAPEFEPNPASCDPNCRQVYRQVVIVTWKEEPDGPDKQEVVANVPIRQVNDQLILLTGGFSWE